MAQFLAFNNSKWNSKNFVQPQKTLHPVQAEQPRQHQPQGTSYIKGKEARMRKFKLMLNHAFFSGLINPTPTIQFDATASANAQQTPQMPTINITDENNRKVDSTFMPPAEQPQQQIISILAGTIVR
jgi:hypothetical protein